MINASKIPDIDFSFLEDLDQYLNRVFPDRQASEHNRLEQITRDKGGRYSAFGVVNGRRFVVDELTIEEAQHERQSLKFEIDQKHRQELNDKVRLFRRNNLGII